MKPGRLWAGSMFLALGVIGILTIAGMVDGSHVIDGWWPVAIVAWPVAVGLTARRISLDEVAVAAIGIAFLADEQGWAVDGLLWTLLFLFLGAAILLGPARQRRRELAGRA